MLQDKKSICGQNRHPLSSIKTEEHKDTPHAKDITFKTYSRHTKKHIFCPLCLISGHLVSGAAHKHLVIILAGSPVTSEYTERTTHGDVLRPSTVTGHTLTSLQHRETHTKPFYPFCLCNGSVEGRSECDTDSEEAKGEQDLSTPQTPSTTHI